MQKINLYRYLRPDGGVTVSPEKPEGAFTQLTRLVAEEGRMLTDGTREADCVDTDCPEIWEEVLSDSEALAIITGGGV